MLAEDRVLGAGRWALGYGRREMLASQNLEFEILVGHRC